MCQDQMEMEAVVFKSNLKIKFVERENVSFEQLFCEVKLAKTTLKLLLLYRPLQIKQMVIPMHNFSTDLVIT